MKKFILCLNFVLLHLFLCMSVNVHTILKKGMGRYWFGKINLCAFAYRVTLINILSKHTKEPGVKSR